MRRRGSVSFVVEVMRRRFPQNGATTSDLGRESGSRISPIGAGRLSVAPLIERERVSDPTIEAAKIAAKRFFSKPGPTRVQGVARLSPAVCTSSVGQPRHNRHVRVRAGPLSSRWPLRHALKCAVLRSSMWRMLDPSSSPSATGPRDLGSPLAWRRSVAALFWR